MGIHIPEKDAVVSGECIQCMQCLAICPKESLSANPAGAIAGTAAAAAIGGTVVAGNLVSFPASETISSRQVTEKAEKGIYKDGVYTGAGEGFRGTTQVQVTVEDGYIVDITVLSYRDDREFFQKAQSAVINAILTEQTPDVSAVSGATFSSSSIMDAVADALGAGSAGQEQPAGNENGFEREIPEAGEESGSGAGQPGAGGGNGHGWGQPGAGQENDSEAGQPGNGRHGGGWHGGLGGGRHRGKRN